MSLQQNLNMLLRLILEDTSELPICLWGKAEAVAVDKDDEEEDANVQVGEDLL
jgi:hypothetical protein